MARSQKQDLAVSPSHTREQFAAYEGMFKHFNRVLFGDCLPSVMLNFSRQAKTYGFFAPSRWQRADAGAVSHEISLNPSYLASRPTRETASTLVHEMCHLWQQAHGTPPRRGYHDREWAQQMVKVGLQPVDLSTGADRMSAHRLSHRIVEGGAFDVAFSSLPPDCLLPWRCAELEAPRRRAPGATGEGDEGEGDEGDGGEGSAPPPPPSRNKIKYTCGGCKSNVWGRPELAILCAPCGQPYESQG